MCEDIYPKITVLIYFNSMSYFKTKAEKMLQFLKQGKWIDKLLKTPEN